MEVDTQSVLTDLQKTRTTLTKKGEDISAEIQRLLAQQEALDKQVASLDVVINLYSQDSSLESEKSANVEPDIIDVSNCEASQTPDNQDVGSVSVNTDEVDFQLNGQIPSNGKKMNMRRAVRENFDNLPTLFTKADIKELIVKNGGAEKRVNENALRSIIRTLKDDNLIEVEVPATGRAKQIYRKVD